jgi:dTDP-4-amino-4,6-dideoxygalactose transaminase
MKPNSYAVPYSYLSYQVAEVKKELLAAIAEVLDSGRYILGPNVAAFEQEFAAYCQTSLGLGVANGTDALHLTLRALGVKAGDEIITAPNSFVATPATIALAGATPVFADIGHDLNIDPERVEAAITPRTRGIVPVHLAGRPARMPELLDIARRHGLFVLEDAAQAVGAARNGRRVGSWGQAACFSLHPLKNLHAYGDGGMVTSGDTALMDHVRKSRNHGLKTRDRCEFWAFNSRLDEIQAAMLRVQLRHLDRRTEERRQLAFRYHQLLRPYVQVPEEGPGEYCIYQTYVVLADRRDELREHLNRHCVEALVHYPTPLHLQPAARNLGYRAEDFPVALAFAARILSLPLYPGMTHAQQGLVAELIKKFYRGHLSPATAA